MQTFTIQDLPDDLEPGLVLAISFKAKQSARMSYYDRSRWASR
jgi:hypothetical protein